MFKRTQEYGVGLGITEPVKLLVSPPNCGASPEPQFCLPGLPVTAVAGTGAVNRLNVAVLALTIRLSSVVRASKALDFSRGLFTAFLSVQIACDDGAVA